jgi:hypothetical protein
MMSSHRLSGSFRRATCIVILGVASATCGSSPVTSTRVEAAIAHTFANLVHAQLARTGLSPIAVSDLTVTTSCYRSNGGTIGAGEWVCAVIWHGPNQTTLRDTYDLAVGTDGCYTAVVDAAESQLGGPTIKTANGTTVRNLLYSFEGCFDTT